MDLYHFKRTFERTIFQFAQFACLSIPVVETANDCS
jgi:hypothetical protein